MSLDINSDDLVYSLGEQPDVLHLDMKPKKAAAPKLEFDFIKSFITKGLYMNGVTFTSTDVKAKNGDVVYFVTDEGWYSYAAINEGKFEGWARNQGGYLAARKEGFTDEQLLKLNIQMGLPIWMELVGPEDVTAFLSGKDFNLYSPKRNIIKCATLKDP